MKVSIIENEIYYIFFFIEPIPDEQFGEIFSFHGVGHPWSRGISE